MSGLSDSDVDLPIPEQLNLTSDGVLKLYEAGPVYGTGVWRS